MSVHTAKILAVDDSRLVLSIVEDMISSLPGVELRTALNGNEALGILRNEVGFTLILMDIEMPDMNGPEVIERIRNELGMRSTFIAACTADDTPKIREQLKAVGVETLLQKPLRSSDIRDILTNLTGVQFEPDEATKSGGAAVIRIAGIDSAKTIERLAGNTPLFHRALGRFVDEYSRYTGHQTQHPLFAEESEYRFFIHTLKGVAAYVGAYRIYDATIELQAHLKNKKNQVVSATAEVELLDSIAEAINGARAYLNGLSTGGKQFHDPSSRPPHMAEGKPDQAKIASCLLELASLLESHDTRSEDLFVDLVAAMGMLASETTVAQLGSLIRNYDYPDALALLQVLAAELGAVT